MTNKGTKEQDANKEQDVQFFKKQERIYPKRVSGRFRNLKWVIMIVTLGIYYLVPFIRWDRGPNAPDQAVLIDLQHGRAYWFWIEIWPQEIYILTGILIFAALLLFFVTSLFGRVWCGYFCFQTVWTDLFIWVERIVQGDRTKRKRLREGPWTWEKIRKLAITHFIWLVIGWCTAGSFVLYFNDAPTVVRSFLELDVSPTVLIFVVCLTFSTYLMAGFAREQVCTFMCPYARFQSAMFDKDTLIITYDETRGEPRGKHKKGESWDGRGHCINCTACVQVCPMGIDIRDGLQMECIACGLCVDACDEIMDKVDLPRGLIRYDTENNMERLAAQKKSAGTVRIPESDIKPAGTRQKKSLAARLRLIRPRTIYYFCVIALVGSVMLYALVARSPLSLTVLHDRNPLFVTLSSGAIRNSYDVKILNKTHQDRTYDLSLIDLDGAEITVKAAGDITPSALPVAADRVGRFHILVEAPITPQAQKDIHFRLIDNESGLERVYESVFISQRPQN